MKTITVRSGIKGWQAKLHQVYNNFIEFESYDSMYGISERLGYPTSTVAWKANPLIQGSVNPKDLCRVSP